MKYFLAILVLLSTCIVADDTYASETKLSDYDKLVTQTYKYKSVEYMQCHYAGAYMREEGIMDKVVEVYIGHPAILDGIYRSASDVVGISGLKSMKSSILDIDDALYIINDKKCKEPAQYVVRQMEVI
ncbi:conserved hypothetical protein [Vibrio phage 150E35-1]|nr:conserved hypothetical protein [Vibrio phage 150E35-1]